MSNGYILRIITSGTGGAENAASNTGTNNGNTGAASGSTANSTAFDSGAASGSTANSTAFDSGAASGNTGSTTLTAAQSGCPAHAHGGYSDLQFVYGKSNGEISLSTGTGAYKMTTLGSTKNSTATNASSGHTHTLNSHKHSVGAHSHGLNSHTHSVGAHSHGLNNHTHTLGSHAHTPGMPANISVYGWKRTA